MVRSRRSSVRPDQPLRPFSSRTPVTVTKPQSLYRFRGATVRNILEFPRKMPGCAVLKLTTNYRSHRDIVKRYDH
jgi:superfamily I DNA/RNA helicase